MRINNNLDGGWRMTDADNCQRAGGGRDQDRQINTHLSSRVAFFFFFPHTC